MKTRRTFLKTLAALPFVGAMVPRVKATEPTLYAYDTPDEARAATSRTPSLTAVYADPHYDRIDIAAGHTAVLLGSVKTVGVLDWHGILEVPSREVWSSVGVSELIIHPTRTLKYGDRACDPIALMYSHAN